MTEENLQENGNQSENQETGLSLPNRHKSGLHLKFTDDSSLPNHRPIESSHLEIVKTFSSVGSLRPITRSELKTEGHIILSGNRPIGARSLEISESYSVMGNRPVASNVIDDPRTLMGYLD
jgi:hypothetical protein